MHGRSRRRYGGLRTAPCLLLLLRWWRGVELVWLRVGRRQSQKDPRISLLPCLLPCALLLCLLRLLPLL